MTLKTRICLIAVVLCLPLWNLSAQVPEVEARFSLDSVMIGDQLDLEVVVTRDVMQITEFPVFNDGSLGGYIDIIGESEPDTLKQDGRRLSIMKKYRLAAFEEGLFSLGGFPVLYVDKNITDTIYSSDSLRLFVETFEIDTATQTIHDIKPILRVPVKFGEWSGYLFAGLAVLLLVAAAIWLWLRRRRSREEAAGPAEAPHERAIRLLEDINNRKLWQNGKYKQYYSSITDVIREYIERRYNIAAPEMTTAQIASAISGIGIPAQDQDNLVGMLRIADLVKFAKWVPDAEECEAAYTTAFYFVENTKKVENEPETTEKI